MSPFDLVALFPLKSQMSQTVWLFFFKEILVCNSFTRTILAVQIQIPAHPVAASSVIGGDSSLSCDAWAGSPEQICGDSIAKQHRGGPVCWFSLCREGGVKKKKEWGRDKTVSTQQQQQKYLQLCSERSWRKNKIKTQRLEAWLQPVFRDLQ